MVSDPESKHLFASCEKCRVDFHFYYSVVLPTRRYEAQIPPPFGVRPICRVLRLKLDVPYSSKTRYPVAGQLPEWGFHPFDYTTLPGRTINHSLHSLQPQGLVISPTENRLERTKGYPGHLRNDSIKVHSHSWPLLKAIFSCQAATSSAVCLAQLDAVPDNRQPVAS